MESNAGALLLGGMAIFPNQGCLQWLNMVQDKKTRGPTTDRIMTRQNQFFQVTFGSDIISKVILKRRQMDDTKP